MVRRVSWLRCWAGPKAMHGHGHDPVGGEELVSASRHAKGVSCVLLGVGEEGVAVEHELPAGAVAHPHGHRGGDGLDGGAGGGVLEDRWR